ncbi:MAG: Mur ligase family protein [Bacteroidales bacterium]|nr:Mur ligase family protein [Bacteroidales bacterium]
MKIHCISVGGAVMHQLAISLKKLGHIVTGSDDEIYDPAYSNLLKHEIIQMDYHFNPDLITHDLDLIILGMHARKDNPELLKAQELQIRIVSYPEFIHEFAKNKMRIVVGGSHGKTTTTAMIMHAFHKVSIPFDYLVGANVKDFTTNVHLTHENPYIILEGDEYLSSCIDNKAKFHWYHPHIAVLTGIAWDHINVYPAFDQYLEAFSFFIETIEPNGYLIYNENDSFLHKLVSCHAGEIHKIPYRVFPYFHSNEGCYVCYLEKKYCVSFFGNHNFSNMAAAMEVAKLVGIQPETFLEAITTFSLPDKRLNCLFENQKLSIYRDFAHAPSKARATVQAIREKYPHHQVVAIYELHTYSSMDESFLPQYAQVFAHADRLIIYISAHSFEIKKRSLIPPENIIKYFEHPKTEIVFQPEELEKLLIAVVSKLKPPLVLLFMSSGNFDHFELNNKLYQKLLIL